mmetsp:Transcript_9243/g.17672  ORF Transcript_9243/g.17672 Transcript_9243/m.17672 type:complete len:214 (+) Transcript_9243:1246-1887(+)
MHTHMHIHTHMHTHTCTHTCARNPMTTKKKKKEEEVFEPSHVRQSTPPPHLLARVFHTAHFLLLSSRSSSTHLHVRGHVVNPPEKIISTTRTTGLRGLPWPGGLPHADFFRDESEQARQGSNRTDDSRRCERAEPAESVQADVLLCVRGDHLRSVTERLHCKHHPLLDMMHALARRRSSSCCSPSSEMRPVNIGQVVARTNHVMPSALCTACY